MLVGDIAPDFSLEADDGTAIVSSRYRDGSAVSLSYRKSEAPACTSECKGSFFAREAFVGKTHGFGMSPDDRASHGAFRDDYGFDFPAEALAAL